MSIGLPQSIRGKVTLATAAVTLVAMAVIVATTAYATQWVLKNTIATSLSERLDRAQQAVEDGDYELAIDISGSDLLQIIDANGNVLASSSNNKKLAPLTGIDRDDDEFELDDLEFEVDDDDAEDARKASAAAARAAGDSAAAGEATATTTTTQQAASGGSDAGTAGAQGSAGGGAAAAPQAPASADDDDDDDDSDDYDQQPAPAQQTQDWDDDDDDDDAPQQNTYVAPAADDDDDDDYDEDEVQKQAANTQAARDDDDDDDDDDDEPKRAKGSVPRGAFVQVAWADDSSASGTTAASATHASGAYIDASDVLGDAGPYLVMKRAATSPDGPVTLAAVTSLAPAVRAGQVTAQLLGAVMLLMLLAVVLFTWLMTERTLRPVEQMRATAESINASDLSARIPVPEGDADLSRLATTFNDMLARVESSFNDQKRFISDASHELKSPVAATSVMIETLQAHPESVDSDQVLSDLESENQRMGSIVGDLLHLARSDEGRMVVAKRPIDLMDLLFEEVASLRSRSSVTVDTADVSPVVCEADPDQMSHVVRNLMDNAARYATSKVKVSCDEVDGQVIILVSDDGPGIPEEDRERVFGRFVRLDDGRSQDMGGTGLGLSVVRSMVEAHDGTVFFGEPEIGGATAVVSIPA